MADEEDIVDEAEESQEDEDEDAEENAPEDEDEDAAGGKPVSLLVTSSFFFKFLLINPISSLSYIRKIPKNYVLLLANCCMNIEFSSLGLIVTKYFNRS